MITRTDPVIDVPAGCKADYEAANNWKDFKEIIEIGDANGDGAISISDAVAIVNKILGNPSPNFNETAADVNGDGDITITDAVAVVNIILGNGGSSAPTMDTKKTAPVAEPE